MFMIITVADTIRVPAHMLSLPTLTALHNEIDLKYPNRVIVDVGLVVCRYGECLKITNGGACVPGDGGSHHDCIFRLVVFRPFVEEVCLGKIAKSTSKGIQVTLGGFFQDIHIPAYWMLRPSKYNEKSGLWVWSPDYGGDDDGGEDANEEDGVGHAKNIKNEGTEETEEDKEEEVEEEEDQHYEMELGAEIRFKVKSIQFTQVVNTAKGVQATTTTTAHSHSFPPASGSKSPADMEDVSSLDRPISLRKRSTSFDLSDVHNLPASMHIVASICEDGLGLTSWWTAGEEEE
jgi:DNA-directed RNA polymerase III subunit RPC8